MLRLYHQLLRTRASVFEDDYHALEFIANKIREEFEKNRELKDSAEIKNVRKKEDRIININIADQLNF